MAASDRKWHTVKLAQMLMMALCERLFNSCACWLLVQISSNGHQGLSSPSWPLIRHFELHQSLDSHPAQPGTAVRIMHSIPVATLRGIGICTIILNKQAYSPSSV